ncbi:MAG: hypothetical protein HOO86_04710 [Bacteroidales bacterium]|nr:hypothetical protein [Bacteroidales bacterium]
MSPLRKAKYCHKSTKTPNFTNGKTRIVSVWSILEIWSRHSMHDEIVAFPFLTVFGVGSTLPITTEKTTIFPEILPGI